MNQLETSAAPANAQPNVIVVPAHGGGGGGFFGRVFGAIVGSLLISGIGYFATYTTVAARLWLKKEGATVEMPAEKSEKAKPGVVERGRSAIEDLLVKTKEQLAKTKEATSGGLEKFKEKGAQIGKKIENKVDKKAEEVKEFLARRQEEAKKRHEEEARQLAIDKAKYDEWVRKFREHYDAQCPKCHTPLRTRNRSVNKSFACARCQSVFTVRRARALGPPKPPPFRPSNRSIWGRLFG